MQQPCPTDIYIYISLFFICALSSKGLQEEQLQKYTNAKRHQPGNEISSSSTLNAPHTIVCLRKTRADPCSSANWDVKGLPAIPAAPAAVALFLVSIMDDECDLPALTEEQPLRDSYCSKLSGSSDSLPSRITPVCSAPVLLLSSLSDFCPLCKCLCTNEQPVVSCHFCTSSFEKAEPRRFRHIRLPRSCARIDSIFCESPPIPAESQRVEGSTPAVSKQRREHTLDLAVLAQHLHSIKALEIWQKFTRSWVETTTEYCVLCGIIKGISGTIVDKSLEQTHLQHLFQPEFFGGVYCN